MPNVDGPCTPVEARMPAAARSIASSQEARRSTPFSRTRGWVRREERGMAFLARRGADRTAILSRAPGRRDRLRLSARILDMFTLLLVSAPAFATAECENLCNAVDAVEESYEARY